MNFRKDGLCIHRHIKGFYPDGRCKECRAEQCKRRGQLPKEQERCRIKSRIYYNQNKDGRYYWNLKTKFGISKEQYLIMLEKQNGVCYICKNPPKKRRLGVDHNHTTGQVRALLCEGCNTGVGHFEIKGQLILKYLAEFAEGDVS